MFAFVLLIGAGFASSAMASEYQPVQEYFVADDADGQLRGTYVRVPAYDDAADEDVPLQSEPHTAEGGGAHILYLNRCAGGTTISGGYPDDSTTNTSSIIGGSVNFAEFPYGDGAWNEVVSITRAMYEPFNVVITDQDPGSTPHDEVIVCGTSGQAGFPGAGGVAPFSCGVIPNAITFVFAETMGNYPQSLAEVIGQESAHAWGLEHEYECSDPMTYLSPCGPKTFQNADIPCGEYSPRACECGGNTQNSFQMIMDLFGPSAPDTQAPVARITYPIDGDVFAPGEDFTIEVDVSDDVELVGVAMYLDGTLTSDDTQAPFGPWPVTNAPEGSYALSIKATDGSGNETTSPTVTVHVSADGAPPPDGGGGGGGGAADDGGADDAGAGGASDGDPVDGGGDFGDEPGALPADYGYYGDDAGCACATTGGAGSLQLAWIFLLAGFRLVTGAQRRRRSGRPR